MADEEQFKMFMLFMREEMKDAREGIREDMRTLRSVVREEVNAAIYASEQRLREEIRTSVYNSEQRIGVRLTNIEAGIDELKGDVAVLKGDVAVLKGDVASLKVRMDSLEARMSSVETKVELTISILDDFSYSIKSLQESLRALEDKVDDYHGIAMREIQKLNQTVAALQKQLTEAIANFDRRLTRHENTPIDQAHPRPHSAA